MVTFVKVNLLYMENFKVGILGANIGI